MASTMLAWLLAASSVTSVLAQATNPQATNLANSYKGFSYYGCYTDNGANDRALGNGEVGAAYIASPGRSAMTIEKCVDACVAAGNAASPQVTYQYVGLEYNEECYCGTALSSDTTKQSGDTSCKNSCAGDTTEACGGSNFVSVYGASGAPVGGTGAQSGPVTPKNIGSGYQLVNCYADTDTYRAVQGTSYYNGDTGLEACASNCSLISDASYLGMTYYHECFCGPALNTTGGTSTGCTFGCYANGSETCGGLHAMQVYNRATFDTVSAASVISASKAASRASVTTSKSIYSASRAASRAAVTTSKSLYSASVAASRAAYTTSMLSLSSVKAASRASVSTSRAQHSTDVANSRASATTSKSAASVAVALSKSKFSDSQAASRASVTTSKSIFYAGQAASRASVTTSRSFLSEQVAESRASVTTSRSAANVAASASRSSASSSRAFADSVASVSRYSASTAKAASVASVLSSKSVASVSNASVKSVASASKASVASVASASRASVSSAKAATMTTTTKGS